MNHPPADQPSAPRNPVEIPKHRHPQEKPQRRQLPPYKVVLHHSAIIDLMFIVRTVMELTRLCRAEATHKMWEAHHCGRSVLLVTYKERAELYQEQFAGRGLSVSVEPA
jgi:ATP-dependent Clp protease adaptor protein ClpS